MSKRKEYEADGDHIEQNISLSGNAQIFGDVIGQVINVIKNPAEWPDAVFHFLSNHRYILIGIAILEICLWAVFFRYVNAYLISWWVWLAAAVLLLIAVWSGYTFMRYGRSRIRLFMAIITSVAFITLLGQQVWAITNPTTFDEQLFGIVVAEIGDGGGAARSDRSREITNQIYERLCDDIRIRYSKDQDAEPCLQEPTPPNNRRFAVKRIGVVTNTDEAQKRGKALNADIIIWGQMLTSEEGVITVRFEVLDTLDQAVNPNFPIVMPVTSSSTELLTSVGEKDLSDVTQLKEFTAQQSLLISSSVLGLLAFLERDFPEAVEQLESITSNVEANPLLNIPDKGLSLLYFYLARAYHHLGNIDTGNSRLEQAKMLNPNEPAVYISLGLGYGSLGEFEKREQEFVEATRLLNNYLFIHTDDPTALYDRGLVNEIRQNYANAAHDYKRALEFKPDFYIGYIQLGLMTYETDGLEPALAWFKKGIQLAEESGTNPAWIYQRMAGVYNRAGQYAQAKEAYEKGIELSPQVDRMYLPYAQFMEKQDDIPTARAAYEKMAEVSHIQGWAYQKLAEFYYRHDFLRESESAYQIAINAQPEDPLLYAGLAITYLGLEQDTEALEAFDKAVALNTVLKIPYVYDTYAYTLFGQQKYQQAAKMYEQSLEQNQINYPALMNLGQTYEALGQTEKARELYILIISLVDKFSEDQVNAAKERLNRLPSP